MPVLKTTVNTQHWVNRIFRHCIKLSLLPTSLQSVMPIFFILCIPPCLGGFPNTKCTSQSSSYDFTILLSRLKFFYFCFAVVVNYLSREQNFKLIYVSFQNRKGEMVDRHKNKAKSCAYQEIAIRSIVCERYLVH